MLTVSKLIPGGQALAILDTGQKIFLWNALPGEIIADYKITKRKSRYLEAIATKIERSSPDRIAPEDPCFLATSPWQILSYPRELAEKQSLVQEIFREHKIPLEITPTSPTSPTLPTSPAPPILTDNRPYHYRNKMEYSLFWNNNLGKIQLAFHARGSHRKVPIEKSSLEKPEIFARAQAIIADLNARHEEARRYQSLLLRADRQGHVSGGLYENHQPHPSFPSLSDQILGQTYHYSPNGFFQINLPVYELALQEIRHHIDTEKVLDLYSGVGTIGLSVARDRTLTLVESDPFAYQELLTNLPGFSPDRSDHDSRTAPNSPSNLPASSASFDLPKSANSPANPRISAHLAKSEDVLDFITSDATIILDPPRAGCAPTLLDRLISVRPPKIIYLSCNPATQARDLEVLLKSYKISAAKIYNFFPRTPHIENLIVLSLN